MGRRQDDTADFQWKVGVRYCGGCNPHYDRAAMVKRLMEKHPEWDSGVAEEGICYDLLIVVGGCCSCCAAFHQFTADRVVKVWHAAEDIPEKVLAEAERKEFGIA
ncbi:MAG: hypothetical protein PUK54_08535 [Firmicutes bacterium]|nr:hypothetical protein [Bacillota bacterium]MDY5857170.1 hypothetical protein [Anaerovoracaceae bacterium]